MTERDWNKIEWNTHIDPSCNLEEIGRNHNKGLIIPPEKGRAVIWLNHRIDKEGVVSGHLDQASMHCGCDVLKGEKFVANQWILGSALETACPGHGPSAREMVNAAAHSGGNNDNGDNDDNDDGDADL